MRPAPPAISSPRISPLCSKRWGSTPGSISTVWSRCASWSPASCPTPCNTALSPRPACRRTFTRHQSRKPPNKDEDRPMSLGNQRVAWFNGKFVRESEVVIPFRDQGFLRGDAVFDMTRSFNGQAFRIEEHVARLYRSLRYLDIDPGLSQTEMVAVSEEVLARNRHLLGPGEDYWLTQRISRGVSRIPGDNWDHYGPNVIVDCVPLPLRERAKHFRDGIDVVTPSLRRTPPDSLSPRAKMHQYLNLVLADREVKAQNSEAW